MRQRQTRLAVCSPPACAPSSRLAATSIILTGDLVLDVEGADYWLSGIAPAISAADIAIGHLEVPHTRRGVELKGDVPAPGAEPDNLAALHRAGFAAVSLAGNHMADRGAEGIADTISGLDALGILHAGAGMNAKEAFAPCYIEQNGRTFALLSFNCVGPENGWAGEASGGCAFLPIETADGSPVTPNAPFTKVSAQVPAMLAEAISAARERADLVIVSLHKGIVHTPAKLAPYERPLAHAAIDAGADVVIGHHAHIVKGIEFYRGRPIFHGLGNGCVVTRALSVDQEHPKRREWAEKRTALFGFTPDPAYTLAPFHPQAINAMLGRLLWHEDGRIEAGIIPVHVEAPGRPVLADAKRGKDIADYVESITVAGGLPPIRFAARDDMMALL